MYRGSVLGDVVRCCADVIVRGRQVARDETHAIDTTRSENAKIELFFDQIDGAIRKDEVHDDSRIGALVSGQHWSELALGKERWRGDPDSSGCADRVRREHEVCLFDFAKDLPAAL